MTEMPVIHRREPASGAQPGLATLMVVDQVSKDGIQNYEAWLAGIHGDLKSQPGFVSVDVIRQLDQPRPEYLILIKFTDQAQMERWQSSQEAAQWLAKLEGLVDKAPRMEQAIGLEIWFDRKAAGQPDLPAYWKRVLLSIACVYPMIMLLEWALDPVIGGLPPAARILLVVVVLSALLTWPIMPFATRILRSWLFKDQVHEAGDVLHAPTK